MWIDYILLFIKFQTKIHHKDDDVVVVKSVLLKSLKTRVQLFSHFISKIKKKKTKEMNTLPLLTICRTFNNQNQIVITSKYENVSN